MAKALMGHLPTDLRNPHLMATDNAKLRARVSELNELIGSLKEENDRLVARVAELVEASIADELQPV